MSAIRGRYVFAAAAIGVACVAAVVGSGALSGSTPAPQRVARARRQEPRRAKATPRSIRTVHRSRARTRRPAALHQPARVPLRTLRLPVLMYHRIDRIDPGLPALTRALTVTPADFAGQMRWIATHGFHTVTQLQVWNALMHGRPLPHYPVLITFDDAYRDVVTYAAPIVRRYHQHATAYVITDRLSRGAVTPWMRWNQLPLLERDGFDIGSHTVSHADLVAVGPVAARWQLRASRFALERFLHEPVQWLAYPYGRVDPTVVQLARGAGYVLAVTTQGGDLQTSGAPLMLHREEVTGTMGVAGVAALLSASLSA